MTEEHRTEFARQAHDFSDLFGFKFSALTYGKARPRRLRLKEPDGPSTAGGRQARQPLVLIPDQGEGNLVVGWVDMAHRQAEVRAYPVLKNQFFARYGLAIDLDPEGYARMRADLEGFLKVAKVELRVSEETPHSAANQGTSDLSVRPGAPSAGWIAAVFTVGAAVGLALGYVLFGL